MMNVRTRMKPAIRTAGLTLSVLALGALAACGSKPAPTPEPAPAPAPQAPAPRPQPRPQPPAPAPVPAPQPQGPVPGSIQDFIIKAGERVYFDFDRYDIRSDARPVLDAQAAWLVRYPQVTVRIEGNADERGTVEYNFALGARRANAIRDYLVSKGVAAGRITTVSYGKSRPIDPRSNEEGWAINRNGRTGITGGAR